VNKPRLKPPTIRIHGRAVSMTGNAKDGYRLRVDELFVAELHLSRSARNEVTQTNWYIKVCDGHMLGGGYFNGCHEQRAANCISRWFESRARAWLGGGK
jgi:hypothetical protein